MRGGGISHARFPLRLGSALFESVKHADVADSYSRNDAGPASCLWRSWGEWDGEEGRCKGGEKEERRGEERGKRGGRRKAGGEGSGGREGRKTIGGEERTTPRWRRWRKAR
eukprot:768715-Hanusia_phi.AAC.2